jgi:hypothetical protein
MVETSWVGIPYKFLPLGGFAQVANRPDHLSKLDQYVIGENFALYDYIIANSPAFVYGVLPYLWAKKDPISGLGSK